MSKGEHRDGLPLARRRIAFLSIALGIILSTLDSSIANTALPRIARELHASPAESVWVINGFQLAVTASLLAFASLGDLYGPARVYRVGTVIFIAGSLLCALSRSLPLLIGARALQGFGAAAIMAISPALVREIFPRAQLGRAVGLNALVVGIGSASGPTIGGLILAVLSWPWLFAINVPIGIANVFLNRALPQDEGNEGQLDLPSVVSSAVAFALLIWGLDGIGRHEPPWTIALRIAVGALAAIAFVRRQRRLERPMIAIDLFGIPRFAFAGATSFATFTAQGLAYVSLPFYFQEALGRTPLESGLLLTSWPLSLAIAAPIAGRLSDRISSGLLATCGLAVLTLGLALYALLPATHPSTLQIVLHGMICGIGYGFFQSPNNRELLGSAPRQKSASAGGLLAAFRLSGQTVGAALVAIIFGVSGASLTDGAARDIVVRAAPAALWLACAFAAAATVASALRVRSAQRAMA